MDVTNALQCLAKVKGEVLVVLLEPVKHMYLLEKSHEENCANFAC